MCKKKMERETLQTKMCARSRSILPTTPFKLKEETSTLQFKNVFAKGQK